MRSRFARMLLAALAGCGFAIAECAAQPYVGIGASNFSLTSQYSAIGARSATGFTLLGGLEFLPTWFTELAVSGGEIDTGATENISYPPDRAEYSILRISIGKHFWPVADRGWTPWVAVGNSYHFVNWDTFYYYVDGSGLSLGAGVDLEPVRSWRVRLQAVRHRFAGRDTYGYGPYDTRTTELSAALVYAFR